jgi:hypothetical protein
MRASARMASAALCARGPESGRLRPIICAALLAAEATLPQAVRAGTRYLATVIVVIDSMTPAMESTGWSSSRRAIDSGNGPPSWSCHQQSSGTIVARPDVSAAVAIVGARRRATTPNCVIDAATRSSTLSGDRPRASAARTRVTRPSSTPGASTRSRTDRQGGAGTSPPRCISVAKKGPSPASSPDGSGRACGLGRLFIRLLPRVQAGSRAPPSTVRRGSARAATRRPARWCPRRVAD